MKHLLVILVAMISIVTVTEAQKKPVRPDFVKKAIGTFEANDYYHGRAGWAQMFAWGEGTYKNNETFLWFAWSNTDGYFQMQFSQAIPTESRNILAMVKDKESRSWDVSLSPDYLGMTNDWFDPYPEGGVPVVTWAMKELRKTKAFKDITVREYLDAGTSKPPTSMVK